MKVKWGDVQEYAGSNSRKLTKPRLLAALGELEFAGWVKVGGHDGDVVWIVKGLEFDPHYTIANPRHLPVLARALADVPACQVKTEFLAVYPMLAGKDIPNVPSGDIENEKSKEENIQPSAFRRVEGENVEEALKAEKSKTHHVAFLFRRAYKQSVGREYVSAAIGADRTWSKWLHEHYSIAEIEELLKRAFSGKFKVQFPSTIARFATQTNGLVKNNLKDGCDWRFLEPLSKTMMTRFLADYQKYGHRLTCDKLRRDDLPDDVLDRSVFDVWVKDKNLVHEAERLWKFFVEYWDWMKAELRKGEVRESEQSDRG
jgi:hypothetical protein